MSRPLLATSEDVLARLNFIRNKKQEYFICLSINSGGQVIVRRTITIGLLDVALAHPREVFSGPLKDHAASIIVAHNHPSGESEPSKEDIKTTQQLVAAGQLLGIQLEDHIIVTTRGYYSFKQNLML